MPAMADCASWSVFTPISLIRLGPVLLLCVFSDFWSAASLENDTLLWYSLFAAC